MKKTTILPNFVLVHLEFIAMSCNITVVSFLLKTAHGLVSAKLPVCWSAVLQYDGQAKVLRRRVSFSQHQSPTGNID